jgi:hypothetical protein
MPNIGDSRSPQGPGIIPFRHRGFDDDSPAFDLDKRIGVVGLEITGRDDNQTPNSIGNYKEDVDTRGDLNCANYWQSADYSKRGVGCWGFGYASVVSKSASGASPNTTGGQGDTTQVQGKGKMEVLPLGKQGKKDDRFQPKNPIVVKPMGSPGGDPNAPGVGGDPGNSGQAGNAGQNPGADPGANGGAVDLGGGWQYIDGAIAYNGPTAQTTDSLSGSNGGYWGGGIGFSFSGGGGVANLAGGGSGFAGFSGVKNFINGSK